MTDKEVVTVGKLRAITAQSRAVDAVEAWVYLPNTRGPVRCYIAGHTMKPPNAGEPNVLCLQIRPIPVDPPAPPGGGPGGVPTPNDGTPPDVLEFAAVAVTDVPDRGAAGKRTERIPNEGDG